jgi:hypothetical protein
MKTAIVPAQITTVEDRITGRLGLSQLLLLTAPIFADSALYVVLPPSLHCAIYKLVIMVVIVCASSLLAIRVKGKILLLWLVLVLRYNLRPCYYVFNKNTLTLREVTNTKTGNTVEEVTEPEKQSHRFRLTANEVAAIQHTLATRATDINFKINKQGGLNVLVTEVKD